MENKKAQQTIVELRNSMKYYRRNYYIYRSRWVNDIKWLIFFLVPTSLLTGLFFGYLLLRLVNM